MKLYRFIADAETLRKGGICLTVAPRSFGLRKAKSHYSRKMEAAYAAIQRFRTKHPDSTRTVKARLRDLERRNSRILLGKEN